ncbi:GNAT family N-acetyltransferase [Pectobacteriaceae bacterium CE70]|nr:GNAT family N-acetyltransferase [Pectobacteriaceae bacterium C52]WJV65864.1 GNAT family N-acetyltransferase [Pectobacteriaceae bacterium CE70]WJY09883.1 GNAT family N-acetyltransferase [Pectobacteriaceae bacterium C80]
MVSPSLVIRHAEENDWDALYDICLKTADAGQDATALYSDPQYPGLRFSVPYAVFEPELAFVLCEDAQPLGYVVAARHTVHFEQRLEAEWWPLLQEKYRDRLATKPLDENILAFIRQPERASPQLTDDYPAHLHINILPSAQKSGQGRKMVETELDALRAQGVTGVHLGVSLRNEQVCAFYEKMGFRMLFRSNALYMGLTL